jgi:hypothetical protein
MKLPADLPPPFQQLSLLRGHGFTADELRRMPPADVAREYVQAVREGAQTPGGAHSQRRIGARRRPRGIGRFDRLGMLRTSDRCRMRLIRLFRPLAMPPNASARSR